MATSDPSPRIRPYLASALQRLPPEERWPIAEALVAHEEDQEDHNLPLMYWSGIEPLVPADTSRALALAGAARIPLLARFVIRRAAAGNETLNDVATLLADSNDAAQQMLVLDEMLGAFEGRVHIPLPKAWSPAYDKLVAIVGAHPDAVKHRSKNKCPV